MSLSSFTYDINSILHHCKRHDPHDSNCKKCLWWNKNGKCQIQKPFDKDATYKSVLEFYIKKGYTKEQANERAQTVVAREIARHGGII